MRTINLVIGCDGTWNEPEQLSNGQPAPTNVAKFLSAMASVRKTQRRHYEQGVGTRAWEPLAGGIYGYGLEKRILGAYRFLRKEFAQIDRAAFAVKIFLIGFSRGAYTARRIAGLLAHSGVPVKASDTHVGFEVYQNRDTASAAQMKEAGRFFDVPVEMVGVWDTVKSTNDADFHDHDLSANVVAGYHAMAIDEHRRFFPALEWNADPRALQVWFAGVHSDVGGGYSDARLSDVALRWMIFRALDHGLQFKASHVNQKLNPSPIAPMHDSFTGIWPPFGSASRLIGATDWIHESVEARSADDAEYHPANLPADPNYWQAVTNA